MLVLENFRSSYSEYISLGENIVTLLMLPVSNNTAGQEILILASPGNI